MSDLYIPNSVALRNFDTLFSKNTFDFSDKSVNIHFHDTYVAMHPVGLAFYAAISDYFRANSINRTASINFKMRSLPFLQRMGLFRVLNYKDPVPTKTHEECGRFIPLTKITTNEELNTFIKSIDPILHTTRQNSRVIKHVFSELLRNVLEHSYARYGGNVCATYNKKKNKISIGISDAGQGLFKSLSVYHKVGSSKEAIIAALTPGISGTTARIGGTPENAGAGLFFTKSIAKATRNHFVVYSGDSYFKLKLSPSNQKIEFPGDPLKDKYSMREKLPPFTGTLVGIDINITETAVFDKLMETIGNAYRLSVKKDKKDYYSKIKFT